MFRRRLVCAIVVLIAAACSDSGTEPPGSTIPDVSINLQTTLETASGSEVVTNPQTIGVGQPFTVVLTLENNTDQTMRFEAPTFGIGSAGAPPIVSVTLPQNSLTLAAGESEEFVSQHQLDASHGLGEYVVDLSFAGTGVVAERRFELIEGTMGALRQQCSQQQFC